MSNITETPASEQVAQVARLAARLILECGGETYRAEDTAFRIARTFGYETDIIAFPTGLTMTVRKDDHVSSVIARVGRNDTNMTKLDQVNTVSRALCSGQITLDEAMKRLEDIQRQKGLTNGKSVLYAGFSAAMFALMFGGGWFEFLASGACGALIQLVLCYSPDQAGMPISSLIGGFLAALLALIFNSLFSPFFGACDISMTIVSTLMPFLPGLALTNAIRDSMRGDLLSGGARLSQALTRAVVLAGGAGAAVWLYMLLGGGGL